MKQTTATTWLIHSLEMLALGAVITDVTTIYQAFQAGHFSFASASVAVGSTTAAILFNGLKGIMSNANFAQAIADLRNDFSQSQQAAPAQPPVVINNHLPPTPAAPPTVTVPQFKNTSSSIPDFTTPLAAISSQQVPPAQ